MVRNSKRLRVEDVFLERQRRRAGAELEQLLVERRQLRDRLNSVSKVITALEAYLRKLDGQSGDADKAEPSKKQSIRDLTLAVLQTADRPLKVIQIREIIAERFGRDVQRPSISSILSKMAEKGEVTRDLEAGWSLTGT